MNDNTRVSTPTPIVVGIGASAGGVETLSELLPHLPAAAGIAYLVVLHLDRTHTSHLAEILAKHTAMPVLEATDGAPIEPDHVYVIMPNTTLVIEATRLVVDPRGGGSGTHMAIDCLLSSIARERGVGGVGIVLSGTGTDGALGVAEIKAAGGITFAQEPASAKFDGMPKSAIDSGFIDLVLPLQDMAAELERIARGSYPGGFDEPPLPTSEEEWKRLFRMLRGLSGVDFSHYKRSTLRRRLARRMVLRHIETLEQYLARLQEDPGELAALYQDFLIRVTSFFRDPASFVALADVVLPRIVERRNPGEPVRVWVPGCSTGEEVYSLAMVLLEFLGDSGEPANVQIFGTDVNPRSIERARAGRYIENLLAEVSPERKRRFLTRIDGFFEVNKVVRDLCVFAEHNVSRDPPFSRLDLVSCRNVLIYLDTTMQKRVIGLFHYALNPDRFLMLGPSESVGATAELFELIDAKRKIFQRIGTTRSVQHVRDAGSALVGRPRPASQAGGELVDLDHLQREADHMLLARFAPAGLLVDERLNVIQFRGQTGRFIEHQQGAASLGLAKLVRPGLLMELTGAISEARSAGVPVRKSGLRNERESGGRIAFEVVPLASRPDHARCFLILFQDDTLATNARPEPSRPGVLGRLFASRAQDPSDAVQSSEREELKCEVEATRRYLQAIIEANEAAQEELRSANEEVLSANEEFQSTNEELETAKEELQSANEELATTNEELRHRNVELSQVNLSLRKARDHSQAMIDTIRQALVLVDVELRVRVVNRAFCELFGLARTDAQHCLLTELGHGEWEVPALRNALNTVMASQEPLVDFTLQQQGNGSPRTLRIEARPLMEDPQHGLLLLLAIDDITERDRSARTLREQTGLIGATHDIMIVHDFNGAIRQWNHHAARVYGWSPAEAIGKTADHLLKTRRDVDWAEVERALLQQGRWEGVQVQSARDGSEIAVGTLLLPVRHDDGTSVVLEVARTRPG
ncbi:MAG: chemotaxis protein CheB [Casimicrobiaceae bacterium]